MHAHANSNTRRARAHTEGLVGARIDQSSILWFINNRIPNSPEIISEIAVIADFADIWNSAAKWDPNRFHPCSQTIVTSSERHEEDRRIPVVPLAPRSMWQGTTYTLATRPENWGGKNPKERTPSCHH